MQPMRSISRNNQSAAVFSEIQSFRNLLATILLLLVGGVLVFACIQQLAFDKPFGNNPMPDVALMVVTAFYALFCMLMWRMRMHTIIDRDGIGISVRPFWMMSVYIPWNDIQSVNVRRYAPFREFGGYGMKLKLTGTRAFIAKGRVGVEVVRNNGKRIMIGTQQPDELTKVLSKLGKLSEIK